jgi:flagellin-like hook-associated protein FlgL
MSYIVFGSIGTAAGMTLNLIQKYREELLAYRSNVGTSTSRISSFMNTLSAARINFNAAESRISDADVAAEARARCEIQSCNRQLPLFLARLIRNRSLN